MVTRLPFIRAREVVSVKAPAEIVAKLNKDINGALGEPKLKERFAELGALVTPMSSAEFDKFIAD